MPSKSAPASKAVVATPAQQLDSAQVLRASTALVRKLQSNQVDAATNGEKTNLLADADDEDASDSKPVWLILTTKKHIIDKKRLKPGKIALPHPYIKAEAEKGLRVCLITADPQRRYKDLVAHPSFPLETSKLITRVIGLEKLKAKHNSFESKRKLLGEYDVFLADDRVITYLPAVLGKVFYKSSSKRPVPVSLEGRRQNIDEHGNKRRKLAEGGTKVVKSEPKPTDIAAEIEKALSSALVHLAPSTTTAVKVGSASLTPAQIQENVNAVVAGLVETYVPQKWRNVRAIHIKGATTTALPIWLTDELWTDAKEDIRDEPLPEYGVRSSKRKSKVLTEQDGTAEIIQIPGADGKMREVVKAAPTQTKTKKQKTEKSLGATQQDDGVDDAEEERRKANEVEASEKAVRKDKIKKQKEALNAGTTTAAVKDAVLDNAVKPIKKRMKAADLI